MSHLRPPPHAGRTEKGRRSRGRERGMDERIIGRRGREKSWWKRDGCERCSGDRDAATGGGKETQYMANPRRGF